MKGDIYDVDYPCKRLRVILNQIVPSIVKRWTVTNKDLDEINKNLGNRRKRAYELLKKCRSSDFTEEMIEERFKWAYKELELEYPFQN